MPDELLSYYQNELTFLRHQGAEFSHKYPGPAAHLQLDPSQRKDPYVERMIEAFAFLAARIHLKLDDEFPEIIQSLLSVLYPHYLRPIPSMTIGQFHLEGQPTTGLPLKPGSVVFTKPVEGYQCRFRTCYETTLWPITVEQAQWTTPDRLRPALRTGAVAALRIQLSCAPGLPLRALNLSKLQFYLDGESRLVHALYELLCNNCSEILVRDPNVKSKAEPVRLPADSIRPMGFQENEAMLPYSRRSFAGYRLLQEYFTFPEKFFFLELGGLEALFDGFQEKAEIVFLIDRFEAAERQQLLETGVSEKTVRLGCSPLINLFPQVAEPILVDHARLEYPIVPDLNRRRVMEIFSIDKVVSIDPHSYTEVVHEPFYSYRHGTGRDAKKAYWHASRRPSVKRHDEGTDMFISLVDLSGRLMHPDFDTVTVRCTCTNRDLPAQLPIGADANRENDKGDFELEDTAAVRKIVALKKPTGSIRPELGKGLLWRLISHLSLNYLSLVADGKAALQEILKLYNFSEDHALHKQIAGIADLKSSRHFGPVESEEGVAFVRGVRVEVEFDEEQYVGGGVYLFASVLEHFLGLYVSMNSFSQLTARTTQRKEPIRQWRPRAGQSILL